MEAWPLFATGMVVMTMAVIDLLWTVIAVGRGSGPITGLAIQVVWRVTVGRRPHGRHGRLEAAGYLSVVTVLAVWVVALWLGLTLTFLAQPDAVLRSGSESPASALARAGYAAGALAGAGAAYVAGSGGWVLLNNAAAVLGLTVATLSVTFLFQVVSATTQERALSMSILGIGASPAEVASAGLGRSQLGALGQQLTGIVQPLAMVSRYHLALPVVSFMHPRSRSDAIEVAVAVLDEALNIVEAAGQDDPGITRPVRQAIDAYITTVHVRSPVGEPPPAPPMDLLGEGGLAEPADHRVKAVLAALEERRARLLTIVEQRGWRWEADVWGA